MNQHLLITDEAAQAPANDRATNPLLLNVLRFCAELRRWQLDIPPAQVIDACRSLQLIDVSNKQDFYVSLKSNLVSSLDKAEVFDYVFEKFWQMPEDAQNNSHANESADDEHITIPDFQGEHYRTENEELVSSDDLQDVSYTAAEILRSKDFATYTDDEILVVRRLLAQLVPRLATRASRRMKVSPKGRQIDLRRTIRNNTQYGGEITQFTRRNRKIRKTKLLLLCDVSGSMESYSKFLIQFLYGVQNELKNAETFVFGTNLTRITPFLRQATLAEALEVISRSVKDWSGGTRIGESFAAFNEHYANSVFSGKVVTIIMSDGWDQGDAELLEQHMSQISARSHRVIWLNPLLERSKDYQPTCRGMSAALPFIDLFLPGHNVESLVNLATILQRLS